MNAFPAFFFRRWQLSALLFSILLPGCVTSGSRNETAPLLPAGYARFDMPGVYENGMASVTSIPQGVKIQLLETFEGSFELHQRADNRVVIRNDQMDYPGLGRSFKGEGILLGQGRAEGYAEIWLDLMGPVRRDHRKGPWVLRPATEAEIRSHEAKVRQLEERKARAGMTESPQP